MYFKAHDTADLVHAYNAVAEHGAYSYGFISTLRNHLGVGEALKEFPRFEYEVKFNIIAQGQGQEPFVNYYHGAIELPVTHNARFLKDLYEGYSMSDVRLSRHMFFGTEHERQERMVIMESLGAAHDRRFSEQPAYAIKAKGPNTPLSTGVKHEQAIMKREERVERASVEDVVRRSSEAAASGAPYVGSTLKEHSGTTVVHTRTGRLFSLEATRCYIGEPKEPMQRQLELEYQGYLPGFPEFERENEAQLAENLVDLARQVWFTNQGTTVPFGPNDGYRLGLILTDETRYDFLRRQRGRRFRFDREDGALVVKA